MTKHNSIQTGAAVSAPPMRDERFRIEMTAGCQDSKNIPKVLGAGQIIKYNGYDVQIMHNGVKVVAGCYYGEWMTEVIARLHGHHEPQEELIFNEIVKFMPEKPTMIELGSFWSYYSLWCLQARPLARVIDVEPDPINLETGKQNAVLNGRDIEFINASVGSESISAQPFKSEHSGTIHIPQVCVPELLSARGIDRLDILHCDTQGAEFKVISSCSDLLRSKSIRFVIVSTHHHYISGDALTHQRCLSLLQNAGGRIIAEHDVAESFSGDGLIAAYFGSEDIYWPNLKMSRNRYSTSLFRNPLYDLSEKSS